MYFSRCRFAVCLAGRCRRAALGTRLYTNGCWYYQRCSGFSPWCCQWHLLVWKIVQSTQIVHCWSGMSAVTDLLSLCLVTSGTWLATDH